MYKLLLVLEELLYSSSSLGMYYGLRMFLLYLYHLQLVGVPNLAPETIILRQYNIHTTRWKLFRMYMTIEIHINGLKISPMSMIMDILSYKFF